MGWGGTSCTVTDHALRVGMASSRGALFVKGSSDIGQVPQCDGLTPARVGTVAGGLDLVAYRPAPEAAGLHAEGIGGEVRGDEMAAVPAGMRAGHTPILPGLARLSAATAIRVRRKIIARHHGAAPTTHLHAPFRILWHKLGSQ